jgi:uncharacterized membrane protein
LNNRLDISQDMLIKADENICQAVWKTNIRLVRYCILFAFRGQ